jgi:eukaryotic-like serine/threonine-protein kinase
MRAQLIGRYEVLALLGEGTFGQVFAARDSALGRRVAIKVLRPQFSADASFMERFHGEATSLAALAHPNVTLIYDLLEHGAQHGMIMELVRGHTLEHVLRQRSQLELGETLAVAAQAIAGLGYIHGMGVVHRDIKPSNIMLTAAGVLKIMDFGIARVQGTKRLTREGSIVGTLTYAAPEQIKRGEGEARSDLYSLACVIYEMICGRPPFEAATEYELMQAHIAEPPEPLSKRVPGVPEVLDRGVMRALAKNPDERFASVEEFGQALGIDAIQSKAVEIVHNSVERAGAIPPLPDGAGATTVPLARPDEARVPRHPEPKHAAVAEPTIAPLQRVLFAQPAVVKHQVVGQQMKLSAAQMTEGLRVNAPFLVIGAAVVVALSVLGFILFDSGTSQRGSTNVADLNGPSWKTDATQKDKAETASKPSPSPSPKPPLDTTPKPPPPPPSPPETPAYQGRVVDWIGGATILVPDESGKGVRYLQLYGVRDVIGTQQQANDIRRQLDAYLDANGRQVSCFKRGTGNQKTPEYQCFIDKQDIGRWAIQHHLAQASPDAPQEYRAASQ